MSVLVVYPHDHRCCPASWQSAYHTPPAQESIKLLNLRYGFLLNSFPFCTVIKLKNHKLNHCQPGTVCSTSSTIFRGNKLKQSRWLVIETGVCVGRGHLGGSIVECLPLARVLIPGFWDRVPHRVPHREPASPSAHVSASLSGSLMNK